MLCLSGEDAFQLNGTYGFPLDLTKEIVAAGMTVDEALPPAQAGTSASRARNARKNAGADAWAGENDVLADIPATEFLGCEKSPRPKQRYWRFSRMANVSIMRPQAMRLPWCWTKPLSTQRAAARWAM